MASSEQNLSAFSVSELKNPGNISIGIVVAEWNEEYNNKLLEACKGTLLKHGLQEDNISIIRVPGAFELPLGAQWLQEDEQPDAVVCIGCLIRGETPHFDYIAQATTKGISELNTRYQSPFLYGLLTVENSAQALDRCGGKHGNKGDEIAIAALKMIQLKREIFKPI